MPKRTFQFRASLLPKGLMANLPLAIFPWLNQRQARPLSNGFIRTTLRPRGKTQTGRLARMKPSRLLWTKALAQKIR